MAKSPVNSATDLVTFKILSAGKQIADTYQVFAIEVEYAINRIPKAMIRLHDGDVAEKSFEASNSNDFTPGTEIEIQAGYSSDDTTIFKGIVVSMHLTLDPARGSVLELQCRDKAILMTSVKKSAFFLNSTDSDAISKLIGNYSGLSSDVDKTDTVHEELVQYDATDWDYMLVRADVNGMIANVSQGKISIKNPDPGSSPVLSLTYGVDLLDFDANLSAIDQVPGVEALSWDFANQEISNQAASPPGAYKIGNISPSSLGSSLGIEKLTLRSAAQVDTNSLKSWADAKLMKSRLSMMTGHASFTGSGLVMPNTTVELNGVGDRFSGIAFVSSVRHSIQDGNWTTEVGFGLEDEWFAANPNVNPMPAGGLTPDFGGLMIAKVKQLDQDPMNAFRILVTLPVMQDDTSGIWARLSAYYATNGSGNFFIPEVGDEVILGFLNSDPNYPVILGSLYSSKNQAPYSPTAENPIKAIVTKSQCKIEFDDEKKIITILTPGSNKIIFSDEDEGITMTDQNNNSITTNTEGLIIKDCNGNEIKMSASGIEITGISNIKISTSSGDVTVSGLNVTNSAQVAMKSSGQASAELSASGQTTIKGAMVMIN
jgi:Rhs element Vgr protein